MSGSMPIVLTSAEALALLEGGFRARYLALVGFAWLVYDYFLTLDQEVSAFRSVATERPA